MADAFDAIVAGCGPAGSACALAMARAGLRVCAVDRREFPRDKLCGGLLTWKAMRELGRLTGLEADGLRQAGVIDRVGSGYMIRLGAREMLRGEAEYPFHLVKRRALDAFLLDQARRAGVETLLGRAVVAVDPDRASLTLDDGTVLRGSWLVGADGVNSRVRTACGVDERAWMRDLAQAMEFGIAWGELDGLSGAHEDLRSGRVVLYADVVKSGYGWVFPNSDRVVVGMGGLIRSNRARFRPAFEAFLDMLGLPREMAVRAKAHPIPYGNFLERPARGRTLLCGDAAGLVEPLFGEGIYYALRSGELAGRVLAGRPSGREAGPAYEAALRTRLIPEMRASKRLRAVLYGFLRLGLATPLAAYLNIGGGRLVEMVHGMRSFSRLRRLDEADWAG